MKSPGPTHPFRKANKTWSFYVANLRCKLGTQHSAETLHRYPRCRTVQLTCFRANYTVAKLYLSLGFTETGLDDEFGEPNYQLNGTALNIYRLS